jgi:hypothetical protein
MIKSCSRQGLLLLISTFGISHATLNAASISPKQFHEELSLAIVGKTPFAAARVAARSFGRAVRPSTNKKHISKYANSVSRVLKKPLRAGYEPQVIASLLRHLYRNYFTGGMQFTFDDSRFEKALVTILQTVPKSEQTLETKWVIVSTISAFALGHGATQEQLDAYLEQLFFSPPPTPQN